MSDENDFSLSSYAYELPPERIAQRPCRNRGDARLLVLGRDNSLRDAHFREIASFLPDNALLVANNTRVLPCRLAGRRESGGRVEFLLLTPLPLALEQQMCDLSGWNKTSVECLLKPGAKIHSGDEIFLGEKCRLEVREKGEYGRHVVDLFWQGDLEPIFSERGRIPLPPYIRRPADSEDVKSYQTVYASRTGAVAAPTAGLHFTEEIRQSLLARHLDWAEVTLHTGYGTFSPVRCEDIREHKMHAEYVELDAENAEKISKARKEGRPIVAVGTTSLRAIEGIFQKTGQIRPYSGWTDIFIYPGKPVRVIGSLITNFHLPESSLLMLVSALAGRKRVRAAYAHALANDYRFFSYGDAMLIL